MFRAAAVALTCALAVAVVATSDGDAWGQGQSKAPAKPAAQTTAAPPAQPFFGLTTESYGPLTPVADRMFVTNVDSKCTLNSAMNTEISQEAEELAFQAALRNPLARRAPQDMDPLADPGLVSAELVNNFKVLSGRTFFRTEEDRGPSVAILSRDATHITFWHMPVFSNYFEVRNAAKEWCQRQGLVHSARGQARRCGQAIQFSGAKLGPAYSVGNAILTKSTEKTVKNLERDTCESLYGRPDHPLCTQKKQTGPATGPYQATYMITSFACVSEAEKKAKK